MTVSRDRLSTLEKFLRVCDRIQVTNCNNKKHAVRILEYGMMTTNTIYQAFCSIERGSRPQVAPRRHARQI